MRRTALVLLVVAGCGSTRATIAGGVGAIAAGSLLLEGAERTEDPARSGLGLIGLPLVFGGILAVSGGVAMALERLDP